MTDKKIGIQAIRLYLCLVSLLTLWISSLSTARFITHLFIEIPDNKQVWNHCNLVQMEVLEQRERFLACAEIQLRKCNESLFFKLDGEINRVLLLHQKNLYRHSQLESEHGKCQKSFNTLIRNVQLNIDSDNHTVFLEKCQKIENFQVIHYFSLT